MRSSRQTFGRVALVALLLFSGATPLARAYKGKLGGFDSGGGSLIGEAYRSVAAFGSQTIGKFFSGSYEAREGFLALYGQPIIGAEPAALAYGPVPVGEKSLLASTVSNYGGVTLLLSDLRLASSEGGPFTLETSISDTLVGPGGSIVVSVGFTPDGTVLVRDTVLANTNDPTAPAWRLPLSGSGLEPTGPVLAISVDSLVFGLVPVDSLAVRTLTIQNAGWAELHVGPITTTDPSFGVSTASFAVQSGGAHDLSVWFDPDGPYSYRDTLLIPSDDASGPSPARVLLIGSVPALLAVTEPAALQLFFTAAEDAPAPAEQQARVRNDGAETLHWEAATPGAAWIDLDPDSGSVLPGNTTVIDVAVNHQGLSVGDYHAAIRFVNRERPLTDTDTIGIYLTVEPFTVQVAWSPDTVNAGGTARVEATASVSPDSGRVFFRQAGADMFQSTPMSVGEGGVLSATFGGTLFDIRGVESFVKVHAGGRTVSEPRPLVEKPHRILVRCEDVESPALPAMQHRMISFPLSTGAAKAKDLLEDDLGEPDRAEWRLGRWSASAETCLEHPADLGAPLDAGFGFWLITRESRTLRASGLSVFPPSSERFFPILLQGSAGSVAWTQIGQPFAFPVNWSDCFIREANRNLHTVEGAAALGLIENVAYSFVYEDGAGHYVASSTLDPWGGYFVNNISGIDLELLVPIREAAPSKGLPAPSLPDARMGEWVLRLRAVSGDRSGEIVVGERAGARDRWDPFDHFVPPPPAREEALLVLRNPGGMPAPGDLRADVRAVAPEVLSWALGLRLEALVEVQLTAEAGENLPDDFEAFLLDPVTGSSTPLRGDFVQRVVPRPGERSREFRIVAGPPLALSAQGYEALRPDAAFSIERPYPNPATRGTTLRFAIPEAGPVRLRLFNIEGRLVRELANETRSSGEQIVAWDGRDSRGREVGPGVYFFRLDYWGETRTARVVVFR